MCNESFIRQCTSRVLVFFLALLVIETAQAQGVNGRLRVHPTNPRYFTDNSGKAIYLGGHQSIWDLQDHMWDEPVTINGQSTLDWNWYMTSANSFMKSNGFNYLRNWMMFSIGYGADAMNPSRYNSLMPYRRVTGWGNAIDGRPKFDLYSFNPDYFTRLRSRLQDAQARGIYVSIMLFDVYSFVNWDGYSSDPHQPWFGNVFYGPNNKDNISADSGFDVNGHRSGMNFFYAPSATITGLQQAYIRQVIDTVYDLDNIFYEVANELDAPAWQRSIVRYIKDYEHNAHPGREHLVYRSSGGLAADRSWYTTESEVVSSGDVFALNHHWPGYEDGPTIPKNDDGKPGFWDNDHVIFESNDPTWPWRAFTRGYHFSLYDMPFDPYLNSPKYPAVLDSEAWRRVRANIGKTVQYSRAVANLAAMTPQNSLASSGYCLANSGNEYIIFTPSTANLAVYGLITGQTYSFQWYDTYSGGMTNGTFVASGSSFSFPVPAANSVLFLTKQTVPPNNGNAITLPAGSSQISAPFSVSNGVVSQSVNTGPVDGGRAAYTFKLTQAATCTIKAIVNAYDGSSDSLYVNIDAEPSGEAMTWDIAPHTSGFEERTVGWRGSSGNEFPVKTFSLAAGTHQLIIRGREPNTRFSSVSIIVNSSTSPPSGGLSFNASDGTISVPFTLINGTLVQAVNTGPRDGGRAAFAFNISQAGNYIIKAMVNAADGNSDSFYVNIDSEPTGETMTWDILRTSGFEERTVGWRGSTGSEFPIKTFALSTGAHQLIIRGREPNTFLRSLSIVSTEAQPKGNGLSFAATSGTISAPFTVDSGGAVSQTVNTWPADGGKAAYYFNVTQAGTYMVKMMVNAPNGTSDSIYVNIDAEPTGADSMAWDIIPNTSGFQERTVGWRGSGTSAPEFPLKYFTLSAGTHQLIVRGREPNAKFSYISIVPR